MGWFSSDRDNDGEDSDSGGRTWGSIIHGSDADGNEVSASFGRDGTATEGHVLLGDGHKDADSFYGSNDSRGHDHYDGQGGGTDRGQYRG